MGQTQKRHNQWLRNGLEYQAEEFSEKSQELVSMHQKTHAARDM